MYNHGSINTRWPGLKRQGWDWPNRDKDGWYRDQNNNLILPATLGHHLCEHLHTTTHLGERNPNTSPDGLPEVPSTKCNCTRDNSGLQSMPANEGREEAAHRNEVWKGKDRATLGDRFTEVRPGKYGYRYLLVLVDTFSG